MRWLSAASDARNWSICSRAPLFASFMDHLRNLLMLARLTSVASRSFHSFEQLLGMERALGCVFMLEENVYVPTSHALGGLGCNRLAILGGIFFLAQAEIREIGGLCFWRLQLLAFRFAQRGIRLAQSHEDFFRKPRIVPEFEGRAQVSRQRSEDLLQHGNVSFQERRQLQ